MDTATLTALLVAIATANRHPDPAGWAKEAASVFEAQTAPTAAPAQATPAQP